MLMVGGADQRFPVRPDRSGYGATYFMRRRLKQSIGRVTKAGRFLGQGLSRLAAQIYLGCLSLKAIPIDYPVCLSTGAYATRLALPTVRTENT